MKKYLHIILAIIVIIMFFVGASEMSENAYDMETLRSVGGQTVAEAYYQSHGGVISGQATVMRALGISLASIILLLGELNIKYTQKIMPKEEQ